MTRSISALAAAFLLPALLASAALAQPAQGLNFNCDSIKDRVLEQCRKNPQGKNCDDMADKAVHQCNSYSKAAQSCGTQQSALMTACKSKEALGTPECVAAKQDFVTCVKANRAPDPSDAAPNAR